MPEVSCLHEARRIGVRGSSQMRTDKHSLTPCRCSWYSALWRQCHRLKSQKMSRKHWPLHTSWGCLLSSLLKWGIDNRLPAEISRKPPFSISTEIIVYYQRVLEFSLPETVEARRNHSWNPWKCLSRREFWTKEIVPFQQENAGPTHAIALRRLKFFFPLFFPSRGFHR